MRLLIVTQKVDMEDSILGFFHGWIKHISKNVEHVYVIALSKGKMQLPSNVTVVSLGKERGVTKIIQAFRFYRYALSFIFRSDGIFVHMAPEYVRALYPLNIFFRKPLIMWYAHIQVSKTARWALSKADKILTPSKESFDTSVPSNKVIATGHGIDIDEFKPQGAKTEPPIILTMSRISKVKRLDQFIRALHILDTNNPDLAWKAMIAGKVARPEDEEYKKGLEESINKYGLAKKIIWDPDLKQSDMSKIYNESSIFVRMQGGGGFGKAELAALSCGIPTVMCTPVYNNDLKGFTRETFFEEDDAERCALNISSVFDWSEQKKKDYSELARSIVVHNHSLETLSKRIVQEFSNLTI